MLWEENNLKDVGSQKTKGPKQDSQNWAENTYTLV
jgi:hypothetical protein